MGIGLGDPPRPTPALDATTPASPKTPDNATTGAPRVTDGLEIEIGAARSPEKQEIEDQKVKDAQEIKKLEEQQDILQKMRENDASTIKIMTEKAERTFTELEKEETPDKRDAAKTANSELSDYIGRMRSSRFKIYEDARDNLDNHTRENAPPALKEAKRKFVFLAYGNSIDALRYDSVKNTADTRAEKLKKGL